MPDSLSSPSKESFLCVTLQNGDPSAPVTVYYTNRSEDYGNFVAMPELEVDLPPNTSQIQDDTASILLASNAFTDRITDGLPTSPTNIRIEEVILPTRVGDAARKLVLFVGKVTSSLRNRNGKANSRGLKARSWRSFLDVRMGYMVDAQCPLRFNGVGCGQGDGPTGLKVTGGTIASIDGLKITMSGSLTAPTQNHYRSGYVTLDGINIDIREFDSSVDDTVLYLSRQPPAYWIGQSVQVFAGCDKTIDRCRQWANEDNFDGVGYGIPSYNPLFQDAKPA